MEQARLTGKPVVVTSLTSESKLVTAKPSGELVAELSSFPEHVARGANWVDVDPTLVRQADGSVLTKATPMGVKLGRGTEPLVSFTDAGRSLDLLWRGVLPAPTLHGDVAVWSDVAPGLDIAVQTTALGARQFFVVRTPQAASNPLLKTLIRKWKVSGQAEGVRRSRARYLPGKGWVRRLVAG